MMIQISFLRVWGRLRTPRRAVAFWGVLLTMIVFAGSGSPLCGATQDNKESRSLQESTLIKKRSDMPSSLLEKCHDGKGLIDWVGVLEGGDLPGKNLKFIHDDVLRPGSSIGTHKHAEDEEYYYIISGTGVMVLNDKEIEVRAGDVTAVYAGGTHGLENRSDKDLRVIVIAVIGRD